MIDSSSYLAYLCFRCGRQFAELFHWARYAWYQTFEVEPADKIDEAEDEPHPFSDILRRRSNLTEELRRLEARAQDDRLQLACEDLVESVDDAVWDLHSEWQRRSGSRFGQDGKLYDKELRLVASEFWPEPRPIACEPWRACCASAETLLAKLPDEAGLAFRVGRLMQQVVFGLDDDGQPEFDIGDAAPIEALQIALTRMQNLFHVLENFDIAEALTWDGRTEEPLMALRSRVAKLIAEVENQLASNRTATREEFWSEPMAPSKIAKELNVCLEVLHKWVDTGQVRVKKSSDRIWMYDKLSAPISTETRLMLLRQLRDMSAMPSPPTAKPTVPALSESGNP
jgi:hypothetical protein